jgi:ribosomal protein S18 acetylase RimI-like enzyme
MSLPIRIVDLRQVSARQLEPLFGEEQRYWLDQLHWDYRPSLQLIGKFIDAKSLAGCAALADGQPAGYGFYVFEESKALIGGLFVAPQYAESGAASRLLAQLLNYLQNAAEVQRIEAQVMPFGAPLDPAFAGAGFRLFERKFMLLPLAESQADAVPLGEGLRLEPWDDRSFEPCARLIQAAYAGHVDAEINDQYRSEAGALRFLKNIVVLPGCGQFQPHASFVVKRAVAGDEPLAGAVLTSCVSHGVGHTTQLCVLPELRRSGLGRRLMAASIQALRSARFHALSLTVTAQNERAVRLYEQIGFRLVKSFRAAVWHS